jgi:hypothetical protein
MQSNRNILQHVRTNTDLVFVRKLNFSPEIQNLIDSINIKSVDWTTSGVKDSDSAYFNGLHKIYPCYDNGQWKFNLAEQLFQCCIDEFTTVDSTAKVKELTRCIMNLTRQDGTMSDASMHQDASSIHHWSFLLYLKGTSGDTDFNQSMTDTAVVHTVKYEPGSLVMFPSVYTHQGHLPVDNNDRIVLNYIVEIDSILNNHILDTSSSILKKNFGVT